MIGQWLSQLAGRAGDLLEKPVERYVDLETADMPYSETSFVSAGRGLVTIVAIHGTRDIRSDDDRAQDVVSLVSDLKPALSEPGHGIEINYCRDPDQGRAIIAQQLRGARSAAESIGLDLTDLLNCQEAHLAARAAAESYHVALWTLPLIMSPIEQEEALDAARVEGAGWPGRHAGHAQNPFLALPALRTRHDGFIAAVRSAFETVQVETSILTVHDAGKAIYESMWPTEDGSAFRLCLPGDPMPVRITHEADPSDVLWPKIGRQFAVWGADRLSWDTARFGNQIVASVDVTLGPETVQDFGRLRDRLARAKVPFRMSMKLRSGGERQLGWGATLAPLAAICGEPNRRLMKALDRVRKLVDAEGCVTWQLSLATWAPVDQPTLLQSRLAELKRCTAQWGTMQVRSMCGDPVQGALSSVLGITLNSTAVTGYAPLDQPLSMLPRRAASPWAQGAVPFLTPDGAVFPYEEGSAELPYTFMLMFAKMRAGKSALLARFVFGNILAAGTDRLPYIAFVDVGPGSSGIIDTLREALPPHRRHEVTHVKLRNDHAHCINILDTPLGCRYPPPDHMSMIVEAFTALAQPAETSEGHKGMASLIGMLVHEAYRLRDDHNPNGDVTKYVPGAEPGVDAAVIEHKIAITTSDGNNVPWWRIVDALFIAKKPELAHRAQRHAVPTASELLTAIRKDSVKADFDGYMVEGEQKLLTVVENELKNSLADLPMCAGITQLEPAARVVALDLQNVLGSGSGALAAKRSSVVYTWCMVALCRRWWVEPRDVIVDQNIPEMYRNFHFKIAEDVSKTAKVFVADEFHETAGSPAPRAAIIKLVRKGPKYRIRVHLSSQLDTDFDAEMLQLASNVVVVSADDETVIERMRVRLGLQDAHCEAMRKVGRRDPVLGNPVFMFIKGVRKVFAQFVYSCMSPMELWAVATDPREVQLRRTLAAKVGFNRAIHLLSNYEPLLRNSANLEVEVRIKRHLEVGNIDGAKESAVINEMVEDMVTLNREKMARRLR